MSEKYYFAYGSNLDTVQMKSRIGDWITSERGCAEGYKRVYNVWSGKNWKGWAANLKKTNNSSDKVYGVVYLVTEKHLELLTNKYEHIPPTSISVRLESGLERENVIAYIWPKEESSHEPPEPYKNAILRGLKQHGYTQDIIEKITREFIQS